MKKQKSRKKTSAAPTVPEKVLVLRTCPADMISRGEGIIRMLCSREAMLAAVKAAESWNEKSGNSSTAASSGDYSTAASSGYASKAASSGNSGIAATIGNNGQAKAGPRGLLIVTYWSPDEKRYRACVGNVGENGILADTWYRVVDGKLTPCE